MVGFIVVVAVADESNILSVGAGEDVGDNLSNMLCVVGGNMVKKKATRHQRLHRNLHEMGIGNRKDPSSTAGQDKNQAEILRCRNMNRSVGNKVVEKERSVPSP